MSVRNWRALGLVGLLGVSACSASSSPAAKLPSQTAAVANNRPLPPAVQPALTQLQVVPTVPAQVGTTEPGNPPQYTCVVTARPYLTPSSRPTQDALATDPGAIDVVRRPGMNDRSCQSGVRSFGADDARQLALDLNAAPMPTPGVRSCPGYDGTAIDLVFRYHHDPSEVVVGIALGECGGVTGPGHGREITPALGTGLARLVPAAWLRSCVPRC
jgi:hypothetical protein